MRAIPCIARRALGGLAAVGTTLALLATTAAPAHAAALPEGGLADAVHAYLYSPNSVPGANDWTCQPSATRPNPVILLPGTFANIGANFVKLSPRLKNAGYCVYAMNYGMTAPSLGRIGGLGAITASAGELDAFVNRVRSSTGAAKVDIVGHSQGGSVPMWWMKRMGNAGKVAHYVGIAPSSHGTDLNGIVELAEDLRWLGFATDVANVLQFPGVLDQQKYSAYTAQLWADGNTVPAGPRYTVISTIWDTVVTPYTSQRLAGATVNNIVLQDRCPWDAAGHVGVFNDGPTMQLVLNALRDGPANFQPFCWDYGLQFV